MFEGKIIIKIIILFLYFTTISGAFISYLSSRHRYHRRMDMLAFDVFVFGPLVGFILGLLVVVVLAAFVGSIKYLLS